MRWLIRLYISQAAIGFGLAAVFVRMLLWLNIANLWHMVSTSGKGWLAVPILWLSNGFVFAGVRFGIAVMCTWNDDDNRGRAFWRGRRATCPTVA